MAPRRGRGRDAHTHARRWMLIFEPTFETGSKWVWGAPQKASKPSRQERRRGSHPSVATNDGI